MSLLASLTPIALVLALMLGLRWSAVRAGLAGYAAALLIAVVFFGARLDLLAVAHGKALLLTLDVLLIIWAAFLLYRVADEAGAIGVIGQALPHLAHDAGLQALLIGWVFASFLQGVGGFGVPVAVVSPILVAMGFNPMTAVLLPSVGHGWAVTFGSLASSFQALIATSGLTGESLAPHAALLLGISAPLAGLMVLHIAGGWVALRRLWWAATLLGLVMGVGQYLTATAGLWTIGAFVGSLGGLLVAFPLARWLRNGKQPNGQLDGRAVLRALSGYAILVVITLAIQLIPPLKAFLGQVQLSFDFPEVQTTLGYRIAAGPGRVIPLFRHAGAVLFYVSALAYWIYRRAGCYAPGATRRIVRGTVERVLSASWSIAAMVAMAVIMEHSGMTDALARGLAEGVGLAFPLVSPWIGALGAFMTGSNTNSNVVFGALQARTAALLNCNVTLILAAQTAGAGLASVLAPAKVVVGASTVGLTGREGDVMRRLAAYTVLSVMLISLLTILFL